MIHLNIKIKGLVQGVFFRSATKEKAQELNINGFVRNESDGSVYIEAEGEKQQIDIFLNWCNSGPSSVKVETIDFSESDLKNYDSFKIAY